MTDERVGDILFSNVATSKVPILLFKKKKQKNLTHA